MFQRGFFLLVIRDDALATTLTEPMQRYSVVRRVRSAREAVPMLVPRALWSGVVIDLDCLDGAALETLDRIRGAHPLVPILAFSSSVSPALVNALHAARAELVMRPVGEGNIVSFVQRALVCGWLPDERVAAWVDELARRNHLTAREVQLMTYALGNESREQVTRRLGITENTLKTQVRALLRKCGARSMDTLAKNVLREALVFDDPATPKGLTDVDLQPPYGQSVSA